MKRDDEIVNAAYNAGQEKYFSELVHRQKKVNSAYGIGFIGVGWPLDIARRKSKMS